MLTVKKCMCIIMTFAKKLTNNVCYTLLEKCRTSKPSIGQRIIKNTIICILIGPDGPPPQNLVEISSNLDCGCGDVCMYVYNLILGSKQLIAIYIHVT